MRIYLTSVDLRSKADVRTLARLNRVYQAANLQFSIACCERRITPSRGSTISAGDLHLIQQLQRMKALTLNNRQICRERNSFNRHKYQEVSTCFRSTMRFSPVCRSRELWMYASTAMVQVLPWTYLLHKVLLCFNLTVKIVSSPEWLCSFSLKVLPLPS